MRLHRGFAWVLGGVVGLVAGSAARAIVLYQIDDFQDGTTMGWSEGPRSPNPPVSIFSGGPAGAGDSFIVDDSNGALGAGSRQIMFNDAQWTGDYTLAGVGRIEVDIANFGTTTLSMRIALIENSPDGITTPTYSSTTPFVLTPDDSNWHHAIFDLDAAHMSMVASEGDDTLANVLSNVKELRLISAADGPAVDGEVIASTIGVDNVVAVPEPGGFALLGSVAVAAAAARIRPRRVGLRG